MSFVFPGDDHFMAEICCKMFFENLQFGCTPQPYFMLVCFNAACQTIPRLNLQSFIFGLILFGWFASNYFFLFLNF
jgi:hypothetical protein